MVTMFVDRLNHGTAFASTAVMRNVLAIVGGLLFVSASACSGGNQSVKPDEMSAEQHKKEAERERQVARGERAAYRPEAERQVVIPDRGLLAGDPVTVYNPTEDHLYAAAMHEKHAAQHAAAADFLRTFEEGECKSVPSNVRAACPLLGPVVSINDVRGGVVARFRSAEEAGTVAGRMRCHYAYARYRGFAENAACPLYVRGIDVKIGRDPTTVEIVSPDPGVEREIRLRSREEAIYAKDHAANAAIRRE